MRKTLLGVTLFLGVLTAQAQEKVMNIQKKDGTSTQTRVAELKQISFLAVDGGKQGLLVKTLGGETATVLFEINPVVTVASGKLTIKSDSEDAVEFEIGNIAEIRFDDKPNSIAATEAKGLSCILQDHGLLLRGLPDGVKPHVYSIDGRSLPTPAPHNGELRLSRESLGTGIFIVKAGTLSTKIRL